MAEELFLRYSLDSLGEVESSLLLTHILCMEGSVQFHYNGNIFDMSRGDCAIVRASQFIEAWEGSTDCDVKIIYADPQFIERATPNNNYGIRGSLSLFNMPVMHLTEDEFTRCLKDYEVLEFRLAHPEHQFFKDMKLNAMQTLILDFFDFHARISTIKKDIPTQSAQLMENFIAMLDRGEYRHKREVSYYAAKLCVTPKYLTEISNAVSGKSANYWINRFTILDISRLLRSKDMDFIQIADLFHFSSLSYFSRYVQRYLGVTPSDYQR